MSASDSVRPVDASDELAHGDQEAEQDERLGKRRRTGSSSDISDDGYNLFRGSDGEEDDAYWDALFDGEIEDDHRGRDRAAASTPVPEGGWLGDRSGEADEELLPEGVPSVPAGARRVRPRRLRRMMPKPTEPSRLERERHEVSGHVMFADWCHYCVQSRGLDCQHRRLDPEERKGDWPTVAVDYCFPGSEDTAPVKMPVLVLRDDCHGGTRAHALETKAIGDDRGAALVKQLVEDIKDTGFRKIIFKADNEVTIDALRDRVIAATDVEVVPQNSIVKQSASNGMIENGVREVEGAIRTMKLALEGRLRARVPADSPILYWLVAHAAELIDRCKVSSLDGMTARERRCGKRGRLPLAEFGECVFFLPVDHAAPPRYKLDAKLREGVFVGVCARSNAYKVIGDDGLVHVRTVKRKLFQERWNAETVLGVQVTPWRPRGGLVPRGVSEAVRDPIPVPEGEPGLEVRRMALTTKDFDMFGFTSGCRGCARMRLGQRAQGHSDSCRSRIEKELAKSQLGRQRLEREREGAPRRGLLPPHERSSRGGGAGARRRS